MDLPWSGAATGANTQSHRNFDANGYTHGYPYSDKDSNCHTDGYPNGNFRAADGDGNCHSDDDSDPNVDGDFRAANGNFHGYANGESNVHGDSHGDSDADSNCNRRAADGYAHGDTNGIDGYAFADSLYSCEYVDAKTDEDSSPDEDANAVGERDSHIGGGDRYPHTGGLHLAHGTRSGQKHRFARRSDSVPHRFAGFRQRQFRGIVGRNAGICSGGIAGGGGLAGDRHSRTEKGRARQRGIGKVKI